MRDLLFLLIHFIAVLFRLCRPGGTRGVIAESVLLKQQLLVLNRARDRAPNLRPADRIIAALCARLMRPTRLLRAAIVIKPATILHFHRATSAPTMTHCLNFIGGKPICGYSKSKKSKRCLTRPSPTPSWNG